MNTDSLTNIWTDPSYIVTTNLKVDITKELISKIARVLMLGNLAIPLKYYFFKAKLLYKFLCVISYLLAAAPLVSMGSVFKVVRRIFCVWVFLSICAEGSR